MLKKNYARPRRPEQPRVVLGGARLAQRAGRPVICWRARCGVRADADLAEQARVPGAALRALVRGVLANEQVAAAAARCGRSWALLEHVCGHVCRRVCVNTRTGFYWAGGHAPSGPSQRGRNQMLAKLVSKYLVKTCFKKPFQKDVVKNIYDTKIIPTNLYTQVRFR